MMRFAKSHRKGTPHSDEKRATKLDGVTTGVNLPLPKLFGKKRKNDELRRKKSWTK